MNSARPEGRRTRRNLTSGEDFQTVYRSGSRHVSAVATVYILPQEDPRVRLGIPTGRRLGSAVTRNRLRRRIREAFGRFRPMISRGADVVIVPRSPAAVAPFDRLVHALAVALRTAELLNGQEDAGSAPVPRGGSLKTP